MESFHSKILIIGAGVIGLALATKLKEQNPELSIHILEKETDVAFHSSGRNSGVLHAGFYYTAHSLKAKFTRDGCAYWTKYCEEHGLKINKCQKVVIAQNEEELEGLYELERRAKANGVRVKIVDESELKIIDPNVKTYQKALYSPTTATVDPVEICRHLKHNLEKQGVRFFFEEGYAQTHQTEQGVQVISTKGRCFEADQIINAAGLYADKIAKDFGYSKNHTILPFKGVYLKYKGTDKPLTINVYPVPNLKNPFLGVHYTLTVDNQVKIGPTAIPAFWRENYKGWSRFRFSEFFAISFKMLELFVRNPFGFRSLALEEMKKYNPKYFSSLARQMLVKVNQGDFKEWSKPGIRAQLLNTKTNELVQDFLVEGDHKSIHILNAVSPAFTSAMPFADWILKNFLQQQD